MAKSFKNSIKNMVTELGLKTTLEITEMEINKLLFGLGREYVEKNVTPLCISLCEILAEKTGVEETFLNRDAVELKESRGRTHMIDFVSKLGLDVYVYKTGTNNNSQFIYNLDWDSEELQSKPNVLYKLFNELVNIYERSKRITLNRFRLVENVREVIKSLLNEHKMTSRIVNLIDNLGLLETLKVTDLSFDDLSDMVKNSVFTRKIKINFIKEFSDSLLDGYDMSTNDTIVYTEYCDKEHEAFIAYVQKEGITVDIYERKWFNIIKSVLIKFNEVDDYYIDIIFDYLTNYYDTYVNKIY